MSGPKTETATYRTLRDVRKESDVFAVYVGYPLQWCIYTNEKLADEGFKDTDPQADYPAIALPKLSACQHDMNKPGCTIGRYDSTCPPHCKVVFCVWSEPSNPTSWGP